MSTTLTYAQQSIQLKKYEKLIKHGKVHVSDATIFVGPGSARSANNPKKVKRKNIHVLQFKFPFVRNLL